MAAADVVIAGGGPAGLATALALRARGLRPLVLDRARPPIDKACGEGLMPDGARRLAALGVRLGPGDAAPFRGIRYLDGELAAEARFADGDGLGVRRLRLHQALRRRAEERGVEILWSTAATGLTAGGIETDRGRVEARWVVGADGLHSRVRAWAGLGSGRRVRKSQPGARRRRDRFGVRRHYRLAPWTDLVEVYWGPGCEAYVTPVARDEVGVAMLWSGGASSFDRLLERFPALGSRLAGAQLASRDRGAGPFLQRTRGVVRGRVALVGDAAGYRDAITGEGLALAFHQAEALAEAIEGGDLRRYAVTCRRLVRLPFALIRLLMVAERHPGLRRRFIRTLAREPRLFARLLAIHARSLPPRGLGLGGLLRLASGLVRG